MKNQQGFMLIELVLFIIITSIIITGLSIAFISAIKDTTKINQHTIATATARRCAEWYLNQRRLLGYQMFLSTYCDNKTLSLKECNTPEGFTISGDCYPTEINKDPNYLSITLNVSGPASSSISLLIGDY